MHDPFTWTEDEKLAVTNEQQLAMLNRLVSFVNERLDEIERLQVEMTDVKQDVEQIKDEQTPNPK